MPVRAIGRAVGTLFLLAFVCYFTGNALVGSAAAAPDVLSGAAAQPRLLATGALLMLANSVIVAAIGVLAYPVLRRGHPLSAGGYLAARTIESVLLAVGIVFLLLLVPLAREYAVAGADGGPLPALARVAQEGNHYSYQLAMIAVSIGGLFLCRVLLRARLVPPFLAVWGLVGYAVFLAGAAAEVLGYPVGVMLSVPGGLFELALGGLLVARGFPAGAAEPDHARS